MKFSLRLKDLSIRTKIALPLVAIGIISIGTAIYAGREYARIQKTYSELIDHHREVYDQLFKTAPDAMVVACPIANDVGHTKDGWVIMMNDRAREMLNFTGSIGNLRLSQVPQFARIDVWGRLYGPKAAQGTIPISTPDFDIELMRFPHVFGLKLRPRMPERIIEHVTLAPALG